LPRRHRGCARAATRSPSIHRCRWWTTPQPCPDEGCRASSPTPRQTSGAPSCCAAARVATSAIGACWLAWPMEPVWARSGSAPAWMGRLCPTGIRRSPLRQASGRCRPQFGGLKTIPMRERRIRRSRSSSLRVHRLAARGRRRTTASRMGASGSRSSRPKRTGAMSAPGSTPMRSSPVERASGCRIPRCSTSADRGTPL